jgi:hypothetical protein
MPLCTADPNLVAIGIAVGDLAHAVGIGFPRCRLKSPHGDLGDNHIEVIDEERMLDVAGVSRQLLKVQVPIVRVLCQIVVPFCQR